jgi:flagellar M-ring protein FliF
MAKFKQTDIDQIKQLVSAAVGADAQRGDQVAVVVRSFETPVAEKTPFYEAPWFSTALHYTMALVGLLMVLLLAVRPLISALKGNKAAAMAARDNTLAMGASGGALAMPAMGQFETPTGASLLLPPSGSNVDAQVLGLHVGRAQQIVSEKPENAVIALRSMLKTTSDEDNA